MEDKYWTLRTFFLVILHFIRINKARKYSRRLIITQAHGGFRVSWEYHLNLVSWIFRKIRKGKSNGREWTIGVEFDESSLLDRGANARRMRKMTGRRVRSFTGGIRVSIHISFSSDPFILGDLDTEGTRDGKRINDAILAFEGHGK